MTLPEVVLWEQLRGERLGVRFRRQHPVGPYVLDFYCSEARLCVEVDGAAHDFVSVAVQDERRDAWLAGQGIRVLRFSAKQVLKDEMLAGVVAAIRDAAAPPPPASPVPLPRVAGEDPS